MEFTLLRGQIKAMLTLVATKDVRYYLNGLHVKQNSFGTFIEATDGHLLGMLRVSSEPRFPDANVILGRDELKALAGTKRQSDEVVEFHVDGDVVKAAVAGMQTTFKRIDGVFPDVARVTPTNGALAAEPDAPAQFNPALLARFAECSEVLGSGKVWVRHRNSGTCLVSIENPEFIGVVMAMRGYEPITVPHWVHAAREVEKNATPETAEV